MAENTPKAPSFDKEDELYQRLRQRLNNNSSPFGIGSISPEELAYFKSKLEPMAYAELVKEFSPSMGMEFFRDAGKIEGNLAEKDYLTRGLNSFNAELSDFASMDRDDDNIIESVVRGAANLPYWATKGVQTGGYGLHDALRDDEDHIDTGDFFDRGLETLGAFAKPLQLGGQALKQSKNLLGKAIKDPKKMMSPGALWRGVKNNKTAMGVGGGVAAASGMDGTDIPSNDVPGLDDIEEAEVSLENPASAPYGGAAQAGTQPDLSNPAGLAAMANNMGNFRPIDRKDKSLDAFQRQGIQRDLMAQAGRTVKQDIANQRRSDRAAEDTAFENRKEQAVRDAWMKSPTNKDGVSFDDLPAEKQAEMRQRFMDSKYYSSEDDRKRRLTRELKDSGGYGVGEIGGGMTMDEFKKKSGMQNEGTSIIQNPDGTFSTNETEEAFDRAGGRDSALNVFNELGNNGAMEANLDHQLGGDRSITGRDGQELAGLTPGSVRMSSNESDYGDARFNSREDALKYLNRKPESQPDTPQTPEEDDDEMNPLLKYGLPIAGAAALLHPGTRKKGAKMLKKGLNVFKKEPPAPATNPWSSAAGSYAGKTPQQVGRASQASSQAATNPWSSAAGSYAGKTPQQVGRASQPAPSMNNPWSSAAGSYAGKTPQQVGRASQPAPSMNNPWSSSSSMRAPSRTPQDVGVSNRPAPQSPWSSTGNTQTPRAPSRTPQDVGRGSVPPAQTAWSSASNTRPARPPSVTPQDIGFANRAAPKSPWTSSGNIRPQTPPTPVATPQSVGASQRAAAESKSVTDYVDNLPAADYTAALKKFGLGANVSRQQLKDILSKTSFGRLSLDNI